MGVVTKFLKLLKPEVNDYYNALTEQAENWEKVDKWAETTGTKVETIENSIGNKLDKGNLPETIQNAEGIYELIKKHFGKNMDPNLLYLNDEGTKREGYYYLDRNKSGLYRCIAETTTTVNSTTYFVDDSHEAISDKLENLQTSYILEVGSNENGNYRKWTDGTLECWAMEKSTNISGIIYNFPYPFVYSSRKSVCCLATDVGSTSTPKGIAAISSTQYTLWGKDSSVAHIYAIGRWK